MGRTCIAGLAAFLAVSAATAVALAAVTPDEESHFMQEAETLMVSGQYDKALPIYARLFGETRRPVHLRNLGRCHQFLKHADEAILTFRQYLLQSTDTTDAERIEVEGFIHEMEDLKKRQEQDARPREPPPSPPARSPEQITPPSPQGQADATVDFSSAAWSHRRKPVGYTLGVVGLAGVVTGTALALAASSAASAAKDRFNRSPTAETWDIEKSNFDSAQSRNKAGWIVAGLGAAMLVGGVAIVATSPKPVAKPEVAIAPYFLGRAGGLFVDCRW